MLTEHREIEIKTLEQSDAAYCYMRIEMRICNLRNGNMLLISSIEICKSEICVRESLQKTPRARRIRFHETIKILKFLILVFPICRKKERKGKERTLEIIKSRSKVTLNDGYLGLYTTPVPNTILRSSNFRLRNASNFNAAIQIFLCLHEPNSRIFHSYDKSRLIIAQ